MGYDFTGGRIFDFPIDFSMGLTTVQRYCAACDVMFGYSLCLYFVYCVPFAWTSVPYTYRQALDGSNQVNVEFKTILIQSLCRDHGVTLPSPLLFYLVYDLAGMSSRA